jgi:hypothetical protein
MFSTNSSIGVWKSHLLPMEFWCRKHPTASPCPVNKGSGRYYTVFKELINQHYACILFFQAGLSFLLPLIPLVPLVLWMIHGKWPRAGYRTIYHFIP